MIWYFVGYVVLINLVTFILFGVDKKRAKQHEAYARARGRGRRKNPPEKQKPPRPRIPEKTLFALAVLGGSIGAMLGMAVFHHKTRKALFRWGMPAILVVQLVVVWIAVKGI